MNDGAASTTALTTDVRYPAAALTGFAERLLTAAGVREDIAQTTARILVEGDLLGHTTHGLALLPGYLRELVSGGMAPSGEPQVLQQRPAAEAWDGQRLPGPWLTMRALDAAIAMAKTQGSGTVTIRRSHHIACLAAYLTHATAQGYVALVLSSDPFGASVAPHNAVTPVFTPNPIGAGIPTGGDPILLDISASYTTNGLTGRLHEAGQRLPHAWLQDAQGEATDDPAVLFDGRAGTLLPLGGHAAGHKGYGLALLVEALTGGLAGYGRADAVEGWGATVFVQAIDPAAFGGLEHFTRQMDWIADACRTAQPKPGTEGPRLPGARGLALAREQLRDGVRLHGSVLPALSEWAQRYGVSTPEPIASGEAMRRD
jgi:LDH2 family malate/lactate/ureidoglycolate dehydrogenase